MTILPSARQRRRTWYSTMYEYGTPRGVGRLVSTAAAPKVCISAVTSPSRPSTATAPGSLHVLPTTTVSMTTGSPVIVTAGAPSPLMVTRGGVVSGANWGWGSTVAVAAAVEVAVLAEAEEPAMRANAAAAALGTCMRLPSTPYTFGSVASWEGNVVRAYDSRSTSVAPPSSPTTMIPPSAAGSTATGLDRCVVSRPVT